MNLIKFSTIILAIVTIEQFTLSGDKKERFSPKTIPFQYAVQKQQPNQKIYDNFSQFLCEQFSGKALLKYQSDAQSHSFQEAKQSQLRLYIGAIKFSRMSELEQKKLKQLPARSIDDLLYIMQKSYLIKNKKS